MFTLEMAEGSILTKPDISLRTFDSEGFELELVKANGEDFTYDELRDQVLLMTS